MTAIVLTLMMGFIGGQTAGQEDRPRVPADSIELGIIGCLKGRVLSASEVRQTDVQSGPPIRARSFRLAGKGDLMKEVKRQNEHIVEVTGIVKRSDLNSRGVKIGRRVVVGGGSPVAGGNTRQDPADNVVVMDITSVRLRGGSCGQ
jgi:hypothetical protein